MNSESTASDLIEALGLRPHPEGGYFREVYRSEETVRRGEDDRSAITTIYFLLDSGQHSRWHVVASDEVWHFLAGGPLELITYDPEVDTRTATRLGPVSEAGCVPVHVVRADLWQAARPIEGYTLVGCTVGPGFEFEDFKFVADIPGHDNVFDRALGDDAELL